LNGLLEALDRYDVALAAGAALSSETANQRAWSEAIEERGVPYQMARAGDTIDLGDGAILRVVGPVPGQSELDEENDRSLVLMVSWGAIDFLLTGDIEATGEGRLLASGASLEAEVLKVAHHGSSTSSTAEFVAAVDPKIAVISAGSNNWFGHPTAQTVARLGEAAVFRTDLNGTVSVSTDGERIWIDREKS
jgi:competence protein ComEC